MTTTIGIDPHKDSHTAVAIDSNENVLDEIRVRSCSTRTVRLREWADRFEERTWAVESAHGLGYPVVGDGSWRCRVPDCLGEQGQRDHRQLRTTTSCSTHPSTASALLWLRQQRR